MKLLVLFSGTGSIEKPYKENKDWEVRGLDLDSKFNPYYNVDILNWNYQKELKDYIPDYIHASPVCKEFSNLKRSNNRERDLSLGLSLLEKSLEIIEYIKSINPNLKYTIENPKGLMRKLDIMKKYNMTTTSYCVYGFPYMKTTDFWYGGFELKLKPLCRIIKGNRKYCCEWKKSGKNYHQVALGAGGKNSKFKILKEDQIADWKYFDDMKKSDLIKWKGYTRQYFRYRIPQDLCEDIYGSII